MQKNIEYPWIYTNSKNAKIVKHFDADYIEVLIKYKNVEDKIKVLLQTWMTKWIKICDISFCIRSGKPDIKFGVENDSNAECMITKICSLTNPYKKPTKDNVYDFRNIITKFNPTEDFISKYKKYITDFDYTVGRK